MKSVPSANAASTPSCSQFIADFLQFEQRNFHKGKIRPQCSHEEIIRAASLLSSRLTVPHHARQLLMIQGAPAVQFH
jgi:hypothetical protein